MAISLHHIRVSPAAHILYGKRMHTEILQEEGELVAAGKLAAKFAGKKKFFAVR